MGELLRLLRASDGDVAALTTVTPAALGALIRLVDAGTINGSTAKTVFETMFASGRAPDEIVTTEGLAQVSDEGAVLAIVRDVIARETRCRRAIPQGQAGGDRLPHRPGDEGGQGQGQPEARRQPAGARARAARAAVGTPMPWAAPAAAARVVRAAGGGVHVAAGAATRSAQLGRPARARRSVPEPLDPRLGPRDHQPRAGGRGRPAASSTRRSSTRRGRR